MWLKFKVWCIYWLIKLRIRPNVWHKCEIELAETKAARLAQWLKDNEREGVMKGKIVWDCRPGTHWARCSCQPIPRQLGEDEVQMVTVYNSGEVRTRGTAKCKECGAEYSWNNT